MEDISWFKPKKYTHFSPKITWNDYYSYVRDYVSNQSKIKLHAFYPLIHRKINQRKYKTPKGFITKENSKNTIKTRKIFFANHLDNHIYSYYSSFLNIAYTNSILFFNKELNNCITAYRRIEKSYNKGKCNIDFAYEVFNFIKMQNKPVTALTFDIECFFDSLDHKHLHKSWCILLGEKKLPDDHYNIYRSLTNFSYVNESDLIHEFDIKHKNELRRKEIECYCPLKDDFSDRVRNKNNKFNKTLIKKHPFIKRSVIGDTKIKCGIPQGTPISAFLSNLYLLEFDKTIFQEVMVDNGGLYRRYSDDLVIICELEKSAHIKKLVIDELSQNYALNIQISKTETINFAKNDSGLHKVTGSRPLQYLGFSFDGDKVYIKSNSLAKYYRNFKRSVKRHAYKAYQIQRRETSVHYPLYRSKIYRYYSHLGKRNFISYATRASNIMRSTSIRRQISKHWKKINSTINIQKDKYNLLRE